MLFNLKNEGNCDPERACNCSVMKLVNDRSKTRAQVREIYVMEKSYLLIYWNALLGFKKKGSLCQSQGSVINNKVP